MADTMRLWVPRFAQSIQDPKAAIRSMDWNACQEWCNFVLMRPTELPADCAIEGTELRPESPLGRSPEQHARGRSTWTISNRSSHRTLVRGENRELRIKQFLYDWAPPAFDHPSLWLSPTVTPFLVKDDVAWLGSDYRKLRAAAASLHRTTIEMSVTQGSFSDSELQELVRGLEVVSAEARQRIDDTSFAELCYQRRHVSDVIAVPVGYWAHKRSPSTLRTTPMASIEVPSTYMGRNVRPPTELGYALDSCIAFGDPESPREAEYIYEYIKEPNLYVRVLVWPPDSAGELSYPPHLDKQPCSHRECAVAGTTVHYAFGTEQYGPHEAVWRLPTYTIMLLVKPVRWTNAEWFLTLLARTVELSQHGRSA